MSYIPRIGPATSAAQGLVRLAGDLGGNADSPTVQNVARANGGGLEKISNVTAAGGTVDLDLANGNVFNVTMNASSTFNFKGATGTTTNASSFTVYLKMSAANLTATWPTPSVKWSGGAPTLSTTSGATDILVFETINGGTTWYGSLVGTNFV